MIKEARKDIPELTDEIKLQHKEHTNKHDKSRQPLLNGLASKYDLKLFQDAQARACEQRVKYLSILLILIFIKYSYSQKQRVDF